MVSYTRQMQQSYEQSRRVERYAGDKTFAVHEHPISAHIDKVVNQSVEPGWRGASQGVMLRANFNNSMNNNQPFGRWLASRHEAGDLLKPGHLESLKKHADLAERYPGFQKVFEKNLPIDQALWQLARYRKLYGVSHPWKDRQTGQVMWNNRNVPGKIQEPMPTSERARFGVDPVEDNWNTLQREAQYYPYLKPELEAMQAPYLQGELAEKSGGIPHPEEVGNLLHNHEQEVARVKELPVPDKDRWLKAVYPPNKPPVNEINFTVPREKVKVPPKPGDYVKITDKQTGKPIMLASFLPGQGEGAKQNPGTPLAHDQDEKNYHFRVQLLHGQDPESVKENVKKSWQYAQSQQAQSYARQMHESYQASHAERLESAITEVHPDPTEKQRKAGNYKLGKVIIKGLPISIEIAPGGTRKGRSKDGKEWQRTIPHGYGYLRGTKGRDKDHLDVYLGPDVDSEICFVIDQVKPDSGKYDEAKVMLFFPSEREARQAYLDCYPAGWQGLGSITSLTLGEFKEWIRQGDTTKPISGQKRVMEKYAGELPEPKPSLPSPAAMPAMSRAQVETISTHPHASPLMSRILSGEVYNTNSLSRFHPQGTVRRAALEAVAHHVGVDPQSGNGPLIRSVQERLREIGHPPAHFGDYQTNHLINLVRQAEANPESVVVGDVVNHARNILSRLQPNQVQHLRQELGMPAGTPEDVQRQVQQRLQGALAQVSRQREMEGQRATLEQEKREKPGRVEEDAWMNWLAQQRQEEAEARQHEEHPESQQPAVPQSENQPPSSPVTKEKGTEPETETETVKQGHEVHDLDDHLSDLFPHLSLEEAHTALHRLSGAPPGSEVTATATGEYIPRYSDDLPMPGAYGVRVRVKHPDIKECTRFVGIDEDGNRFIRNEMITLKSESRGSGLGSKIFAQQVKHATEHGFDYLVAHAAGNANSWMNGYYTWPSLGYDQSLEDGEELGDDEDVKEAYRYAREEFPKAETVQDIFDTLGGAAWWKEHGADMYNARFDLTPGSRSMKSFQRKMTEKAQKANKSKEGGTNYARGTGPVSRGDGGSGSSQRGIRKGTASREASSARGGEAKARQPTRYAAMMYQSWCAATQYAAEESFSHEPAQPVVKAPPFHSRLQKTLEALPVHPIPVQSVKNRVKKFGVPDEEWHATRMDQALVGKPSVTPAELLGHFHANKVMPGEVWKGHDPKRSEQWKRYGDLYSQQNKTPAELAEMAQLEEHFANTRGPGSTKYDDPRYKTPGGSNYREMLLTMPKTAKTMDAIAIEKGYGGWHSGLTPEQKADVKETYNRQPQKPGDIYQSPHWDEPNVLAHVRFNDRTGPGGEKILHVEEIQSDAHQTAREKGYKPNQGEVTAVGRAYNDTLNSLKAKYGIKTGRELQTIINLSKERWDKNKGEGAFLTKDETDKAIGLAHQYDRMLQLQSSGVPDLPYKTSWPSLAMKRMLYHAAENGYDRITLNSGEQIRKLVGGEEGGQNKFYDETLPNIMAKLGKPFGVKPEKHTLDIPGEKANAQTGWETTGSHINDFLGSKVQVTSLPITPEMRKAILEQGFPHMEEGGIAEGGPTVLQPGEVVHPAQDQSWKVPLLPGANPHHDSVVASLHAGDVVTPVDRIKQHHRKAYQPTAYAQEMYAHYLTHYAEDAQHHWHGQGGKFASKGESDATKQQSPSSQPEQPSAADTQALHTKILSHLATAGKGVLSGAVKLEHGISAGIQASYERLPDQIKPLALGMYKVGFSTYISANRAVRSVARGQGLSDEQVESVALGTTIADSVLGGKLLPMAVGFAGGGPLGAMAAGFVPVGSLCYLGFSYSRTKWRSYLAAKKAVQAVLGKGATEKASYASEEQGHISHEGIDLIHELCERAKRLGGSFDDWLACFGVAMDETGGSVKESLDAADEAVLHLEVEDESDLFDDDSDLQEEPENRQPEKPEAPEQPEQMGRQSYARMMYASWQRRGVTQ